MILVKRTIQERQILSELTANDAFNLCAVVVGSNSSQTLVVAVYRAP